MGSGHAHPLHLDRPSPVHRLAPEVKILATLLFTIVVVLTPREEFRAFGGYALLLAAVAALARVPVGWLAKRATIELEVLEKAASPRCDHARLLEPEPPRRGRSGAGGCRGAAQWVNGSPSPPR